MAKKPFVLVAISTAFFAVLCGIILIAFGGSSDAAVASPRPPTSLDGHWTQTKNGIRGTTMSGDIRDGKITLTLDFYGTTGVQWLGTFDYTDVASSKPITVVSIGDQDSMERDILASLKPDKTFTYINGDLSCPFSIAGMSTIVHFEKAVPTTIDE